MANKKNKFRKRIVVTGGCGYIGYLTAIALIEEGYEPVILDINPPTANQKEKLPYIEQVDINDTAILTDLLKKYSPICVFHFAANTNVSWCESNRILCKKNNIAAGISLLKAMNISGCNNIIFSSSAAVYGDSTVMLKSNSQTCPKSVYGYSKLEFEGLLHNNLSIHSVILRYFNVFGENPKKQDNLFTQLFKTIQGEQQYFTLRGATFDTIDGTAVRDYVHIQDIVQTNIKAMKYLFNNEKSIIIPVGSGIGYSVKEVISEAERLYNRNISIQFTDPLPFEINYSISQTDELKNILKHNPKQSSIREILQQIYN